MFTSTFGPLLWNKFYPMKKSPAMLLVTGHCFCYLAIRYEYAAREGMESKSDPLGSGSPSLCSEYRRRAIVTYSLLPLAHHMCPNWITAKNFRSYSSL